MPMIFCFLRACLCARTVRVEDETLAVSAPESLVLASHVWSSLPPQVLSFPFPTCPLPSPRPPLGLMLWAPGGLLLARCCYGAALLSSSCARPRCVLSPWPVVVMSLLSHGLHATGFVCLIFFCVALCGATRVLGCRAFR